MPNPTISSLTLPVKNPTTGEVTNVTYDLPSGGSGGGGHTIENSAGTDLTQRDTLKFGAGFSATDDSTNEKTVINPDTMTSSDMEDVITPVPGPMPTREGIKYSTTEQVVGEWIDGKTLYQKTIADTMPTISSDGTYASKFISIGVTTDYVAIVDTALSIDSGQNFTGLFYANNSFERFVKASVRNNTNVEHPNTIFIGTNMGAASNLPVYVTVRYTKTTS